MEETEDIIEPLGTEGAHIMILALAERDSLIESLKQVQTIYENQVIEIRKHEDLPKDLSKFHITLIEYRLTEAFNDISLANKIRTLRPMMPILGTSINDDLDFSMMTFENGANDFFAITTPYNMLAVKFRSFHLFCETGRVLEIKNSAMVDSYADLRVSKQKQKAAEIKAEYLQQTKEIMDSLQEGYFYINRDFLIGSMVSQKCHDIFGCEISGQKFTEALKLKDDRQHFIKSGLEQVFDEIFPDEVSLGIIPKEVTTEGGKIIRLDLTIVRGMESKSIEKVIFVATDITEHVAKEALSRQKELTNRCLINVLKSRDQFLVFLEDFKEETYSLTECEDPGELKKILHTLKGNSGAFGFGELAKFIHEVETSIDGLKAKPLIKHVRKTAPKIAEFLREFLANFEEVLGISYDMPVQNEFSVGEDQINKLQKIADSATGETAKELREILHLVVNRPISLFTQSFDQAIERNAEKQGKQINFSVTGEDIRIESKTFSNLMRNLVHALNNSVDHGIELPDERQNLGKSAAGNLKLDFSCDAEKTIIIRIQDDGQGINREALTKKALAKKIITSRKLQNMLPKEIDHLIFEQGLSSADTVSYTSGRGIGMSALQTSAISLGGHIEVNSKPGEGTDIKITIPWGGSKPTGNDRPKLMICEDEEELRQLYSDILDGSSLEIETFSNGLDGLLALNKERYDLIITDLKMPGMEGDFLIQKIREVRKEDIPILVVSGYLNKELERNLTKHKNVMVLPKDRVMEVRDFVDSLLPNKGYAA